ncbi:helix-turn-helix transcriptional regulator [Acinetobacter sp. B5B]|uniref:helix-turn-helix domain-containing protein n=1 Tax=Acinetobacter TaxID=469 RepID=UPI0018A2BBB9|nr:MULTISPECIES: helix-turn-helix transcriptional regulator [Acinetobacter]MBF7683000.1 helix-turn-helix transcriptional regulator [Acinetobacter baretiae]MBF7696178.1 helix-turn-helix transcriptional regulator [Acinetobacter rathckeae]
MYCLEESQSIEKKQPEVDRKILIGRRLAKARILVKLSQSEVMNRVFCQSGKTKTANKTSRANRISEIENGHKIPDAEILQKLCLLYGVSADWVLGFTIEPEFDRNSSRVGLLLNGVHDVTTRMIKEISQSVAEVGANYLGELPKSCHLELLDRAKILIAHNQGEISDDMAKLMTCVRECEVALAREQQGHYKQLDNMAERDTKAWQEILMLDVLQVEQKKKILPPTLRNLDLFSGGANDR